MPYFLQALVSNEHLNDPKLWLSAVGDLEIATFDLLIEGHRPPYKLSRSLDLCLKLNLII